ncbi:MAG: NAD(P)/FAD-dependent oxidoreductase [Methanocellales archaeon]
MKNYDVVVIGAGPAGSMAAKYASRYGASTLLIEEHEKIGFPVHCAGLISKEVLRECELEEGKYILNKIRGAYIYSPSGKMLAIDGRETKAYVVDREIFDRELADRAISEGVEVLLNTKALKFSQGKIEAASKGRRFEIKCKVAIAADGLKSKIARDAELGRVKKILSGAQIEAGFLPQDSSFVEIYLGRDYAPGFFAWAVPINRCSARIGVATSRNATGYLEHLLTSHVIASSKHIGQRGNFIRWGIPIGTLKKAVASGLIVVGDAAGQVKPTTGGGVYMSAVCAKIAGEVAAKAALEGNTAEERLLEYEKRWRSKVGRELFIGLMIHECFSKLSDIELEEFIETMGDSKILEIITEYGDIDKPSIVFKKLLFSNKIPKLWKLFKMAAEAVIRGK